MLGLSPVTELAAQPLLSVGALASFTRRQSQNAPAPAHLTPTLD
jgi:hypothetical protein